MVEKGGRGVVGVEMDREISVLVAKPNFGEIMSGPP